MTKTSVFFLLAAALCACTARPTAPNPDQSTVMQARVPASTEAQAIYSYLAFWEYLQEQKPVEAARSLEKTISIAPTAELYIELGNLYWRTSRFADATRVLKEGLSAYPEERMLLNALAKSYAMQGRFDDAVLTLDDYLKEHPHTPSGYSTKRPCIMEERLRRRRDRLSAIPKRSSSRHRFCWARLWPDWDCDRRGPVSASRLRTGIL